MSHRAIQRLRQQRGEDQELPYASEEKEDDESEDDNDGGNVGFAAMMAHDDSSSSAEESEEEEEPVAIKSPPVLVPEEGKNDEDPEPEDLETLLEEFKMQDTKINDTSSTGKDAHSAWYGAITSGLDTRDLDIDYVMRTSLLGGTDEPARAANSAVRRGRQTSLFGPPRDNWPRPPHFVGGGIGMTTYDTDPQPLPWPYSEMKEGDGRCPSLDRWFKFNLSDNYIRDCEDHERVKASGDPNALAMFIAHHPFVTDALLQLSRVLYQTNQSQEGLSLLKRVLFVYECAALHSFLLRAEDDACMDKDLACNQPFFEVLLAMIRVSHVAGLPRASLALSRFLLSLDPLRDPMGVLLALDYFALQCNDEAIDRWLVNLVETETMAVFYRDEENPDGYECPLLALPNWAFSYALALFRLSQQHDATTEEQETANDAMHSALSTFPSVLEELLLKNEVDTTGRSCYRDWSPLLAFARELSSRNETTDAAAASAPTIIRACTQQAYDLIVRIFVQQNFQLWSSDAVLRFLYDNMAAVRNASATPRTPLSPALLRYARCDPADYQDKFQTMPADANPLDPGVVQYALVVNTNRPRFLQRMHRGGDVGENHDNHNMMLVNGARGAGLAGPPTDMIDPDWPLLEVFWRSALPWAHVEGVPPPRR